MFEVSEACHNHCYSMLIAVLERKFVLDGTTRLNNGFDTFVSCYFHAVREGEECITCHDSSFQLEAESFSFFNGMFQCIYTTGLSHSGSQQLFSASKYDGIALAVLHDLRGFQCVYLYPVRERLPAWNGT